MNSHKKVWVAAGTAMLVVAGAGLIFWYATAPDAPGSAGARLEGGGSRSGSSPPVSEVPSLPAPGQAPNAPRCTYRPAEQGSGETRPVPTPSPRVGRTGVVPAKITTNLGTLTVELDADRAPCTVHSFLHLVAEDYYTETACHRLTTDGIYVLQCGDPSGTGTGTPGYQFDEENLPDGASATGGAGYPRGTLAMANAGPGTNGAQFFVVYRDSDIPPDYTIFGRVTGGLDIVERVAAAGTEAGAPDGRPALDVQIDEITLA